MPPDQQNERWSELVAELRAYRKSESDKWGTIDDRLLARYLADESTSEEKAKVEEAAKRLPAVAQAIEVVRSALSFVAEESGDFGGTAVNASTGAAHKYSIEATKSGPSIRKVNWWRRVGVAACAVCVVGASLAVSMILSQRAEIGRLTTERDEFQKKIEDLGRHQTAALNPLVPTRDTQNRPVDWATIIEQHYDKRLKPEENLTLLEKVGGEKVRTKIAELRREKAGRTARDILDALFREWGDPTNR